MSTSELDTKVKELRELKRMQDELTAEIESLTDSIKAHMDERGMDTILGMDWRITYKPVTSSRLDSSALKRALPEIAERFTKVTTVRRFTVA